MKDNEARIEDNRASWNARAQTHAHGGYGDLAELIETPDHVTAVARRDLDVLLPHLPSSRLSGLKLLHLQCHIGTDTICWPRLGANEAWGLDFSPIALESARAFARQAKLDSRVHFIEGDAREASTALADHTGTFDIVLSSAGTITWLPSLDAWARSIFELLAPGGIFMIRDDHPLLFSLDFSGLQIISDYKAGALSSYEADTSYTVNPESEAERGALAHTDNHNWSHDFQEITSALIDAGLVIEAIGEHEVADWRSLPDLTFNKHDEGWRMPQGAPRIPLTFSIVARKPY